MLNWVATFVILIGVIALIVGWQGTYKNVWSIVTNKQLPQPCPPGTFRADNGQCVQSWFSQIIQQQHGASV